MSPPLCTAADNSWLIPWNPFASASTLRSSSACWPESREQNWCCQPIPAFPTLNSALPLEEKESPTDGHGPIYHGPGVETEPGEDAFCTSESSLPYSSSSSRPSIGEPTPKAGNPSYSVPLIPTVVGIIMKGSMDLISA